MNIDSTTMSEVSTEPLHPQDARVDAVEADPLAGLTSSEQHFVRQRIHPPPGGAVGANGKPAVRLRFSRPSCNEAAERFVDAESTRHSEKRAASWRALDMSRKWKLLDNYIKSNAEFPLKDAQLLSQALLGNRLRVTYDAATQSVTRVELLP